MRRQNARHFRFAGNAVTTRIFPSRHVHTTTINRPAENNLLGLVRRDLMPGEMRPVSVVPVEKRRRLAGHPVQVYILCQYNSSPIMKGNGPAAVLNKGI
jgi:hypothetical protein